MVGAERLKKMKRGNRRGNDNEEEGKGKRKGERKGMEKQGGVGKKKRLLFSSSLWGKCDDVNGNEEPKTLVLVTALKQNSKRTKEKKKEI